MKTIEQINEELSALSKEKSDLTEAYTEAFSKLSAVSEKMKSLLEAKETIILEEALGNVKSEDPVPQVVLEMMVCNPDQHSTYAFNKLNNILSQKYGLKRCGYSSETNQSFFDICLTKSDSAKTKKQLQGIMALLPLLKPVKIDFVKMEKSLNYIDNFLVIKFGILEKTLSEYGVYNLCVEPDMSKCHILKATYGNKKIQCSFDSVEKALDYIEENLYYDRADGARDAGEEDDDY